MRAEFYIAQVIRWNPKLRAAVCSVLDLNYDSPEQVLETLRGEYALISIGGRLGCDREQVFRQLKDRLARRMGAQRKTPLASLGPTDVSLFFDDEFVRRIAEVLECSSDWTELVPCLLDLGKVGRLLERTGISGPDEELPVDRLFWRMVSPDGIRRVFRYLGGPVDIWGLLTTLVNEQASESLCRHFTCKPDEIFAAVRGAMDADLSGETRSRPLEEDSERLDMLAVAKFQELFRTVGNTFLREAISVAERLWESAGEGGARMLLPLLHFYGNRAYREALRRAVSPTQSLGSLGFQPERLSQQPWAARIDLRATITDANEKEIVLVEFRTPPEDLWQRLLRLHGLTRHHREHVVAHLPRSAGSLQGLGETLVERVIQCPLPALSSPERAAWNLMIESDDSLIRYFVLANRHLPDDHDIRTVFASASEATFDVAGDTRTLCATPQQLHQRAVDKSRHAR